MKKLFLMSLIILATVTLSSCDSIPQETLDQIENYQSTLDNLNETNQTLTQELEQLRTSNNELNQDIKNLEVKQKTLEDTMTQLNSDFTTLQSTLDEIDYSVISLKLDAIADIDVDAFGNLEDEITALQNTVTTMQTSITTLTSYDLENITSTLDSISNTVDTLNTTLLLLTSGNDVDDLADEIHDLLLEVDLKLNYLRSYDISEYNLDDDVVQDLIYKLKDTYESFKPSNEFTPERSSNSSSCSALTYEICQKQDGEPKLYTNNYNIMNQKIEYFKEKVNYIEYLDNFLNSIPGLAIPVFPEETDKYEDGEITYSYRSSNQAIYELQYFLELDDTKYRFDTHLSVTVGDVYLVQATIDVKEKGLLYYSTEETINYEFYYDEDTNNTPLSIVIQETNYPINSSITLRKTGDIYAVTYYKYEELKSRLMMYTAFNEEYAYLYSDQDSYSPDVISFTNEEYFSDQGLFLLEDNSFSSYNFYPLKWYENLNKVYYREDGELTKIRISKVILDDNSEIIVSDEDLDDNDTKIMKIDLIYFGNDYSPVELNDYLVYADGQSSVLETNVTPSSEYNSTMNALNNLDLDDYLIEGIDNKFDIDSYDYLEEIDITKSKTEVYNDALRLLEVAEKICSSGNCYYSTLDQYLVGFDEIYYRTESVYVYYPNNYKKVYLYARYVGDYEFIGKNPNNYTKDDVTINP